MRPKAAIWTDWNKFLDAQKAAVGKGRGAARSGQGRRQSRRSKPRLPILAKMAAATATQISAKSSKTEGGSRCGDSAGSCRVAAAIAARTRCERSRGAYLAARRRLRPMPHRHQARRPALMPAAARSRHRSERSSRRTSPRTAPPASATGGAATSPRRCAGASPPTTSHFLTTFPFPFYNRLTRARSRRSQGFSRHRAGGAAGQSAPAAGRPLQRRANAIAVAATSLPGTLAARSDAGCSVEPRRLSGRHGRPLRRLPYAAQLARRARPPTAFLPAHRPAAAARERPTSRPTPRPASASWSDRRHRWPC